MTPSFSYFSGHKLKKDTSTIEPEADYWHYGETFITVIYSNLCKVKCKSRDIQQGLFTFGTCPVQLFFVCLFVYLSVLILNTKLSIKAQLWYFVLLVVFCVN